MYHVLKYISEHIGDRLTLEEMAERFSYSKWYFCESFKSFTGVTFTEYIRHRRMQLAASQILSGKKFSEVAMDCGYDTQSGFNKAFLREFGCLPGEFKKDTQYHYKIYKERKKMYTLSERCEYLKQMTIQWRPDDLFKTEQRGFYFLRGVYKGKAEEDTNENMIASGLCEVIDCHPPIIYDRELIVGYNYGITEVLDLTLPENRETHWKVICQALRDGGIPQEELDTYYHCLQSGSDLLHGPLIGSDYKSEKADTLAKDSAISAYPIHSNHSVIGYEKVLRLGFEGILKELEQYSSDMPFYRGVKKVCRSACRIGERYAREAERLMACEKDPVRKEELKGIRDRCSNVPRKPASSFAEAIQSLLFSHIINTWEDFVNANSLGRLDQILYPYYRHDIEQGIITRQQAFELVCCLWLKLYRDYDVQQSCVGGCDAEGRSAVNALSYMMLDATETLGFIRCLSVRYDANTDKKFIQRALEVVGHVQKGVPFFFNDSVMIPALVSHGIALEDARDYTQIGCVETVIPGKSNPHAVTARCNFLRALEYVLNSGRSMDHPERGSGLDTGSLSQFKTFAQLKEATFSQVANLLDMTCESAEYQNAMAARRNLHPFKSVLTEGCMERGRDFSEKGARYDYYQIDFMGIPNLADSLEAIRELIYKRNRYTLEELVFQLKNNWPDEAMRLEFLNKAPKFGNDIDSVDELATEITNFGCDKLEELSRKYGLDFHAQPFTFLWMTCDGKIGAASADGRRRNENIAYSVSPMQGRDFNGFTALVNSLCKLPTKKTPGTTSAIVEVEPKLFTDKNIPAFADIMLAAAENGLSNIQFNVVDAETLKEAQRHPEKYQNLAVRVSGFSQKFCLLDKNLQDHIIARTKHRYL